MARPPDMIEKHVLITNIRTVDCNDVRMSVSAIVISRSLSMGIDSEQLMVKGFGPDPAWLIFDQRPKSVEYALEDATPEMRREDKRFFVKGHRQYSSTKLTVGGMEFLLYHENSEFTLDVQVWEEHRDERPIMKVWGELTGKVAQYWTAPGMFIMSTVPVEVAREYAAAARRRRAG